MVAIVKNKIGSRIKDWCKITPAKFLKLILNSEISLVLCDDWKVRDAKSFWKFHQSTGLKASKEINKQIHIPGEAHNFRYFFENIKNPTRPINMNSAVYLLFNAKPMEIPAKIQYWNLFSKIPLYKKINESVQNSSNGTSGVETRDKIEINIVELINNNAFCAFFLGRNKVAK